MELSGASKNRMARAGLFVDECHDKFIVPTFDFGIIKNYFIVKILIAESAHSRRLDRCTTVSDCTDYLAASALVVPQFGAGSVTLWAGGGGVLLRKGEVND